MLQWAIDLLKTALHPSSIVACLSLMMVGLLLLYLKSGAKFARRWLIAVMAGYWIIATPLGARLLMSGLTDGYGPVEKSSEVPGASAIVVLGGGSYTYRASGLTLDAPTGSSALRALEAARLYRLLGDPLIIASGGIVFPAGNPDPESEMLGKALVVLGVPPHRIVYESLSRNTMEQAARSKAILQAKHIDRFVLVTSSTHMKRSMAVFRAAGLSPYPSASRLRSEGLSDGWRLMPQKSYLDLSDEAIYDYLALGYYWVRGRM